MENDIKSILTGLRHIAQQIDGLKNTEFELQSKECNELNAALSKFQGDLPTVFTDDSGFKGKFLSFPGIVKHVKGHLKENCLSFTQDITEINLRLYVITTLRHASGQWHRAKSPVYLPKRDEIKSGQDYNQECGKAISYMRRYALESILGIKGDSSDYDR
jgi:hypothetical protein